MDLRPVAGAGSSEPQPSHSADSTPNPLDGEYMEAGERMQTSHSGDSTPNPLVGEYMEAGESSGGGAAAGSREDEKPQSQKHMDLMEALKQLAPFLEAIAAIPWIKWGLTGIVHYVDRMPCNSRKRGFKVCWLT